MKIKHYILLVLVLCANLLFAQEVRVTATLSNTEVGVGQPFEITFAVNGNAERFNPPVFNGFQVVSGPNQSSSMTSINGNTTMSMSLSYDLVALKEGEYIIGAANVVANGKTYKSNTVKIKVVKGRVAPQNNPSSVASSGGRAGGGVPEEGKATDITKELFIRAIANKSNPYQGEQLVVSYKLYTNVNLVDNTLDKLPDFNGFWSQEIKNNNQKIEWSIENYNGRRYHVAILKQIILFPERSGNLILDPLGMTFMVRRMAPSNDIFEQMFGGGSYQDLKCKVSSAPVTIRVKPLPENGKPEGFQGAVGNYTIQTNVDKSELKANEALNYSVKITGSGNLKLLNAPNVNFAADVEKYDPKVADQINVALSGVSGSREYQYLLIPRHEGSYAIEPLKFSYFNPATQRYVSLTGKPFSIKVAKGAPGSAVTAFSGNQQDIKMLNKDIAYLKTGKPDLQKVGESFYGSGLYILLIALGPLGFLAALWYRKRLIERNRDMASVKGKNASKLANKHLASASKQLKNGDKKAFYEDVYKGLYGYLSDKLTISAADLNKENISEQLRNRHIEQPLINRLTETLDLCEMARYAPITGSSEQEIFDKAKSIINDIEAHA